MKLENEHHERGPARANQESSKSPASPGATSSPSVSLVRDEGYGGVTTREQNEMQASSMAEYQKALVVGAFTKAERSPRDEEQARLDVLRVCKRPIFAEKAKYAKPVGTTKIVGPSIRMAEEMGRLWRNLYIRKTVLYDDAAKRLCNVTVLDLESNLSYSNDFTIIKTVERKYYKDRVVISERMNSKKEKIGIVVATDDEVFMKESAQASKEIRTGILRLIPEWLKEEAMSEVDKTRRSKIKEDPEAAKRKLLDAFADMGVLPANVEAWLGHPLANMTPDELAELQDMANTMRDGQTTWADYMGERTASPRPEPAKGQVDEDLLKGVKAGPEERHTPVSQPVHKQESGPDPMDDIEAVMATIEECVRFLGRSVAGEKALLAACEQFGIVNPLEIAKGAALDFAKALIAETDKLKARAGR